uniref:non-specific serine/threonine protein kinase n=1 Tax=Schmidtea mediterranea TaxID=79327 RepID=A0A0H3YFE5_SCHMD|nr:NEK8-1 [Schmidtea mediterranea]
MDNCRDNEVLSNRDFSTNLNVVSYVQVRVLGKGAYGKAVLYRNAVDNSLVVWKEIDIDKNKINEIQNEIDILSILDHPNIVAYYNHFVYIDTVFIEMEYANAGSLSNYLRQLKEDLSESCVLWYFFQLIYALDYIHKLHIIHRDIKTLNIFLTTSTLLKIGDFGISKVLNEDEFANTQVGTPVYMSPEVIQGLPYSSKSDIWASGCVLYEIISRKKLFEYSNHLSLAMKIINGEFQTMPNCNNSDLLDLLQRLLLNEPTKRPSAEDVLKHPVWKGNCQSMIDQVHRTNQANSNSRPCSGDRKERSIVSLNSEVFVWGGGKINALKIEQFQEKDSALQVAAGGSHFVVLTAEKDLYTWSNIQGDKKLSGQLGHGAIVYKIPKLVQSLKGVCIKEVSCGEETTICLSTNGEMFGCGSNYYGELGINSNETEMINQFEKITVTDPIDKSPVIINQISCGHHHAAAIGGCEDLLFTWGCGEYGRLGLGHEDNIYKPTLVDIPLHKCKLKLVYCGYDTTFIVHKCSDRLLGCGNNQYNKLGINIHAQGLSGSSQKNLCYDVPFETKFKIVAVLRNVKVSTVSCGNSHTAVLDIYNKLYIFGDNSYGQIGLGHTKTHKDVNKSSKVFAGKKIEKISCGDYFTIVSTTNNEIFGWGRADSGRLGLEITVDQRCVLHPRALFGTLQKCADIQSFGWQTIMITERILETSTISANSTAIMDKLSLKNVNSFETEYDKDGSGDIQTWLRKELQEDVIYMDQVSVNLHSINVNSYSSNNSNELYSCECGCQKCQNYIKFLENRIRLLCDKNILQ